MTDRGRPSFAHRSFLGGCVGATDCPNPLDLLGQFLCLERRCWAAVFLCRRCDEVLVVGRGVERFRYSTSFGPRPRGSGR